MYSFAQMLHAFMFVSRHWRLRCLLLPRWGTEPARHTNMGISTAKIWKSGRASTRHHGPCPMELLCCFCQVEAVSRQTCWDAHATIAPG